MFKSTLIVVWQPSGYMVRAFHWQYGDILLAITFLSLLITLYCLWKINILYYILYYTTKIGEFVCPPNISETIAARIMKLAHRPRIASTMIKLIFKPTLPSILSISLKTIQRIGLFTVIRPIPFVSAFPSLGHPAPGSSKPRSLYTTLCDYRVWVTDTGGRVRVKQFSQSEFSWTKRRTVRAVNQMEYLLRHSNTLVIGVCVNSPTSAMQSCKAARCQMNGKRERESTITAIYKDQGDHMNCSNYRWIKLPRNTMKLVSSTTGSGT